MKYRTRVLVEPDAFMLQVSLAVAPHAYALTHVVLSCHLQRDGPSTILRGESLTVQ